MRRVLSTTGQPRRVAAAASASESMADELCRRDTERAEQGLFRKPVLRGGYRAAVAETRRCSCAAPRAARRRRSRFRASRRRRRRRASRAQPDRRARLAPTQRPAHRARRRPDRARCSRCRAGTLRARACGRVGRRRRCLRGVFSCTGVASDGRGATTRRVDRDARAPAAFARRGTDRAYARCPGTSSPGWRPRATRRWSAPDLPMATVATGMPRGICTIDSSESMPDSDARLHGHADDRQACLGGRHAGQMGGAAGPGDQDLEAALDSGAGVLEQQIGSAVSRYDPRLERDAELGQRLGGVRHRRPVRLGPHDDADQWFHRRIVQQLE